MVDAPGERGHPRCVHATRGARALSSTTMSPSGYGLALALLWGCVGCCATTVRSGRPPQQVPPGYDERWHSELFWGVVAAGAPYDLARICPTGWSQVTV